MRAETQLGKIEALPFFLRQIAWQQLTRPVQQAVETPGPDAQYQVIFLAVYNGDPGPFTAERPVRS